MLLNPLPYAQLVLGGTQELRFLLGVDAALERKARLTPNQKPADHDQVNWTLTSYNTSRTLPCRCDVAVSVLTPLG